MCVFVSVRKLVSSNIELPRAFSFMTAQYEPGPEANRDRRHGPPATSP